MGYPLKLQAKPGNWQSFMARRKDPKFASFEKKILERDHFACQFCGFQAHEFQEIVNLDGDYRNNTLSNMAVACGFCAQCLFLESVGLGDYGGGTLIYLPEIAQTELNSFCHVLFCAITNDTGYKNSAQALYRSFKFRSQIIEKKYGESSSQPHVFGQLFIDSGIDSDEVNDTLLRGFRLLPSRVKFRKQIEAWAASALEELSTEGE